MPTLNSSFDTKDSHNQSLWHKVITMAGRSNQKEGLCAVIWQSLEEKEDGSGLGFEGRRVLQNLKSIADNNPNVKVVIPAISDRIRELLVEDERAHLEKCVASDHHIIRSKRM